MRALAWQDVIGELEFYEPAATLILMYLSVMKTDYPYNMAEEFKNGLIKENGWSEKQLKLLNCLRNENQIRPILVKMEEEGLVISAKEPKGRRLRHYSLNIEIVSTSWTNEGFRKILRPKKTPDSGVGDNEMVGNFLKEQNKNDLVHYLKIWSKIEKFDYITFLGFLKDEASDKKHERMKRLLQENIHDYLEVIKASEELKSSCEMMNRIREENKARKIKDELSSIDNLLDKFDGNP
jgi:hypothetical protein